MANQYIDDYESFKKKLMKKAKEAQYKALVNEVTDKIKKTAYEHTISDVYDAGSPIRYKRRFHNNGLLDDDNVRLEYKIDNDYAEIEIYNDAKFNGSTTWKSGAFDEGFTLMDLLQGGYGDMSEWYNAPRSFVDNTIDELNENDRLQKTFNDAFEKYFKL